MTQIGEQQAVIRLLANAVEVRFVRLGSFTTGVQFFGRTQRGADAARAFCYERTLQILFDQTR